MTSCARAVSRARSSESGKSRVLLALVGLLTLALLPATAQAHYPYEVATPPAWWTETLGPPVTGDDGVTYTAECVLTEYGQTDEYGGASNILYWIGPPEEDNDFPPCERAWGPARVACSGQAGHSDFPDGPPNDPTFDFGCSIRATPNQLRPTCRRSSYSGFDEGWDPYDCRPEVLAGWPNNPNTPAGDSKLAAAEKAACTKRQCSYEVTCENPTGDAGCGIALSLGDRHVAFTKEGKQATPQYLNDGQTETLVLKTTKQGRRAIVEHLRNGDRSVKGYWYTERFDIVPEPGEGVPYETGDVKIKLKR